MQVQPKTKKIIAVIAATLIIPGGLYGLQLGALKSAGYHVAHDTTINLVDKKMISIDEGLKLEPILQDFMAILVKSTSVLSSEPSGELKNWYQTNRDFLIALTNKNMSKEKKRDFLLHIKEIKGEKDDKVFSLETQKVFEDIINDLEKQIIV